ncbi:MAG TPA: MBL fold metallo-hydrolase [Limnochordia bacterium]
MHPFMTLPVPAGSVGIHWFGQSSFAFKAPTGEILLADPYFPHERPAERFIHPEPPLDEATLRTDYVLLTHDHSDHTHPETLRRIRAAWPQARFAGPKESVARLAAEVGVEAASTLLPPDRVTLGPFTIHAVYAKPPGGDPERGIAPPDVTHLGYVIEVSGRRLYLSGDPINTFAECDELVDPLARLRPEVGILTTHPTEGEFPYFEGSAAMARRIGVAVAIPSHYQCFCKRNYDPAEWAAHFPPDGPRTLIIPYNEAIVYPTP